MIIDQVRMFFDGIISHQRIDIYCRTLTLLAKLDVTTSYYYIEELIATRDLYDNQDIVFRFDDIMFEQLAEVFEQFGISVVSDTKLEEQVHVLEGMTQIEHRDDIEDIAGIIEAANDSVEAICAVLQHVTNVPEENFMLWIEDVKNETLLNITNLVKKNVSSDEVISLPEDYDAYEKRKEKIKTFLIHRDNVSVINAFVSEGIRIGTDFDTLFDFAIRRGLIDFTKATGGAMMTPSASKENEPLVYDLIACALFAGLDYHAAIEKINNVVTQSSVSQITAANILSMTKELGVRVLNNG